MATPVKLNDIVEGMEFQSDEATSYLNKKQVKWLQLLTRN